MGFGLEQASVVTLVVFSFGLLGAIARWLWNRRARARIMWTVETVSLLEGRGVETVGVQLTVDGQSVIQPATARIVVKNAGLRAIRSTDFDNGQGCEIQLPGRVKTVIETSGNFEPREGDSSLLLRPQLLNGNDTLAVDVLLENFSSEVTPSFSSSLADVPVVRGSVDESRGNSRPAEWNLTIALVTVTFVVGTIGALGLRDSLDDEASSTRFGNMSCIVRDLPGPDAKAPYLVDMSCRER